MGHGRSDWAQNTPIETVYGLQDLGEHAVRVGSIVSYHRTGNVIWMDNMEDNINKWRVLGNGTGAAAALTTAEAHTGKQSMKVTGGSNGGALMQLNKQLPIPILSKIGFEVTILREANVKKMELWLFLYDGSYVHRARLTITTSPSELAIRGATGSDQTIATIPSMANISTLFQNVKYIVDFKNEKYDKAILFRKTYDLSEYTYEKKAVTADPRLSVDFIVYSDVGTNGIVYIDNIIFTENE